VSGGRLRRIGADTRPLREADFRRLWLGNGVAFIGFQLTAVAVAVQVHSRAPQGRLDLGRRRAAQGQSGHQSGQGERDHQFVAHRRTPSVVRGLTAANLSRRKR